MGGEDAAAGESRLLKAMGAQTKEESDLVQSEVASKRSQSGLKHDHNLTQTSIYNKEYEEAGMKKADNQPDQNPYRVGEHS